VKPHPDRSNLVPSAKSQFPNSKIHIMKHFRHPPHCCGRAITLQFWPPRSPDLTACDFFLWGS